MELVAGLTRGSSNARSVECTSGFRDTLARSAIIEMRAGSLSEFCDSIQCLTARPWMGGLPHGDIYGSGSSRRLIYLRRNTLRLFLHVHLISVHKMDDRASI